MWTLEIDDLLVRLCADEEVLYAQPGIAHIDGKKVVFGDEALQRLFSDPVNTHTTFWQRMNEDTLEIGSKSALKNSDLIHQQLAGVIKQNRQKLSAPGLVVVPSDYDANQIGLLWGILEFLNLAPTNFVDAALLACLQTDIDENAVYIDCQLERTLIAEVTMREHEISVGSVKALTSVGSIQLMKRCIDAVADRSLDETRFDPRVAGETEQQLFEGLQSSLASDSDLNVNLNYRGETHSLSLAHEELETRARETFERILDESPGSQLVVVSQSTSQLPGLPKYLRNIGKSVKVSSRELLQSTLKNILPRIHEPNDVSLLKSFGRITVNADSKVSNTVGSATEDSLVEPTHALYGDVARPLDTEHSVSFGDAVVATIQKQNGALLLQPIEGQHISINDLPAKEAKRVFNGDRIQLSVDKESNEEVVLIHVVENG